MFSSKKKKDCSNIQNLLPVGSGSYSSFQGNLDAQNFSISNLNIDLTGSQTITSPEIGLFSSLKGATVKNLFFLNSVVKSSGKNCGGGGQYGISCKVGILAGKKEKLTLFQTS